MKALCAVDSKTFVEVAAVWYICLNTTVGYIRYSLIVILGVNRNLQNAVTV